MKETFDEKYDRLTLEAKDRLDEFIFGNVAQRQFEMFNQIGVWYINPWEDRDKEYSKRKAEIMSK